MAINARKVSTMEGLVCCGRNTTGTRCSNHVGVMSMGIWHGSNRVVPICLCVKHAITVRSSGLYTMLGQWARLEKKFLIMNFPNSGENRKLDGETKHEHKIRIAPALAAFKEEQEQSLSETLNSLFVMETRASVAVGGDANEFTKEFIRRYLGMIGEVYGLIDDNLIGHILNERVEQHQVRNNIQIGDLGRLATDNQSVHTSVVVQNVHANLMNLFKSQKVSDAEINSMGLYCEIMSACSSMTDEAKKTFSEKYFTKEKIYDINDDRIYARTLLAVWKFIQNSPHKEDLVAILKVELTDNVGMCAQGNLTRLLNVLNGYLDGMEAEKKSINDEFSELQRSTMSHEDKLTRGKQLLDEYKIHDEELRNTYLENI